MYFSERDFPKEFIKKKTHQNQLKNKLHVQIKETSIIAH